MAIGAGDPVPPVEASFLLLPERGWVSPGVWKKHLGLESELVINWTFLSPCRDVISTKA